MEKNLHYYEEPTQVKIYNEMESDGTPCYNVGIAYQDYVICACCGCIIEIEDAFAFADEDSFGGDVIVPFEEWVDFSDYIDE